MSIAAMADVRLQRTEANKPSVPVDPAAPKTSAGTPAGVLNTLVQWTPTETVATYVAVQAVMPEVIIPKGQLASSGGYTDRWILFAVMLVFTIALVPIYALIKTRSCTTKFEWPVLEMLITAAAFTLWVMALGDSPFADFSWFAEWMKVMCIVAGGGLLGAVTIALKATPEWSDAPRTDAPPSPRVGQAT